MRLNLGDVLEFVAAAAVGMALARSVHDLKGTTQYDFFTCLEFVSAFMAGISLVMGLRLWFEARRPQEYRVWGIGRWTWSLCASSIVLHVALRAVVAPLIMHRRNHRIIMHFVPLFQFIRERRAPHAVDAPKGPQQISPGLAPGWYV
jgi:hypothetical protein